MAVPNTLLSWHQEQWRYLQALRRAGRLPHALMFTGPRGIGKERLAGLLAQSLLCREPQADDLPCGECPPCRLYRAGTHPDVREVRPEEAGRVIRIDQIRAVTGFLGLKSPGSKVALISPAQSMNLAAANSLLKTLEEPPPQSLIVLVVTRGATLPATVRSRCQRLDFPGTYSPAAIAWLKEQGNIADPELLLTLCYGAPLAALAWAERGWIERRRALFGNFRQLAQGQAEPAASASAWLELGVTESLRWLIGWLGDMIRLKSVPDVQHLENPDLRSELQALASSRNLRFLHEYLERLYEALKLVGDLTNINGQMLLEGVLISWTCPTHSEEV
jgi:DNA polymerase-3 subunit delta'